MKHNPIILSFDGYALCCFLFIKGVVFENLEKWYFPNNCEKLKVMKTSFQMESFCCSFMFVVHIFGRCGVHWLIQTSVWKGISKSKYPPSQTRGSDKFVINLVAVEAHSGERQLLASVVPRFCAKPFLLCIFWGTLFHQFSFLGLSLF